MINIVDTSKEMAIPPLWRLGFRPFFLFGSSYAIIAIMIWLMMLHSGQPTILRVPALWWHVHEMVFGFAFAIVAGFLLTAVQNWTGINGTKQYPLMALFFLWLLARLLFWLPLPIWGALLVELIFLAGCGYAVGRRVIQARRWNNLIFIGLFLLAGVADIAAFATLQFGLPFSASNVWMAMLWWFTLLLSVMGARVIPFFTARRFQFEKAQGHAWLDWVANIPLLLLFVGSFAPVISAPFQSELMFVSGVAQLIRFIRWKPWKSISEPLVWSLHLGYVCIPLSLLLRAVVSDSYFSHSMLHLFVIGGLAGVILSMIARVTLGHTGRNVYAGPPMAMPFVMLFIAAMIRSFGAALFSQHYMLIIDLTATLWVAAFAMYLFYFAPMLLKTRADGHPG